LLQSHPLPTTRKSDFPRLVVPTTRSNWKQSFIPKDQEASDLLQLTLSGFDYPLNVLSRFQPASHYFRLERSWDSPFRVLIPTKILSPLSKPDALLPLSTVVEQRGVQTTRLGFRALYPLWSLKSSSMQLALTGPRTLLGFSISEVYRLPTGLPIRVTIYCALYCKLMRACPGAL
jgi:hypothetical protein